jgi:hypothetical protein
MSHAGVDEIVGGEELSVFIFSLIIAISCG